MSSANVYPCNPTIRLDADQITSDILDNADVATWNGFTAVSVGGAGLPKLRTDDSYRYVRFGTSDASASKGNYLDLGSRTWNLQNGFTAIGVIRFYATKNWQRWFDFGNGQSNLNIVFYRIATQAAGIDFYIVNNNGTGFWQNVANVLPNNAWTIVIARIPSATQLDSLYNPSVSLTERYTNVTGTAGFASARTLSSNWIARSHWGAVGDSYSCLDIRETLFYDRALSDADLQNMIAFLRMKYLYDAPLPTTGPIAKSTIRNFMQPGITAVGLGNLYRNGVYNSIISSPGGIPASGAFAYSSFYGAGWRSNPTNIANFFAWYTPQSWSTGNNRWEDVSGNARHTTSTRGTITVGTSLGITALIGNTAAGVQFPASVLPATYTLFHVARYTGGSRLRIFNGIVGGNWLSGFWGGFSGVAYHEGWLIQTSTSLHGDNWVISCDQNRIYRSNGVQRNNALPTGSSRQLTINHDNVTYPEYSDWAVAEVIVYDRTLTPLEISRVERYLSNKYNLPLSTSTIRGALDLVTARSSCVAAYAMKRLSSSYSGPIVRFIRANDSAQSDFHGDASGNLTTDFNNEGTTFSTWVSGTSANIVTWYDQTGRGKHITVSTATRPAIITGDSNAVYFTGNEFLSTTNIFDTTTVSTMHMISTMREISRVSNTLISLNGSDLTVNRFSGHMSFHDGTWYWDPWGGNAGNRANSPANLLAVNTKAIFSGYKGGFRVNQGATYTSPQNTAASVAGGLRLGHGANHYIYNLVVFNNRLSTADETFLELNL